MVERGGCRHQAVVSHFDERIPPCGDACDVCLGVTAEARIEGLRRGQAMKRHGRSSVMSRPGVVTSGPDDAPVEVDGWTEVDEELFQRLRTLRRRLADERDVPAYVVFSDATLLEMARARPRSPAELLGISGVGTAKLDRYGEMFLALISSYAR